MRDRLLRDPAEAFGEADLAEALFERAPAAEPGGLAARALARFGGSYAALLCAPTRELRAVEGLGRSQHALFAVRVHQALAVRLLRARAAEAPALDDHAALLAYLNAAISRERVEQFRVLFLAADGRLVADEAQSRGTVNHTPVYPREVVKRAREHGAAAVVLVHNHPSGDPTPSSDDVAMTARVRDALAALGLALRDHIVVGNGRHLSFRREGLL